MQTTFDKLGLKPTTLRALQDRGFDTPTPIQALAIPIVLQREDLIGQAQTGTGKTLAFGLPIIEDTEVGRGPPQSLVLAPTRELANQIVDELNKMATLARAAIGPRGRGASDAPGSTPFKAAAVYGGVGFGNQIAALRRGDITCIVACPGRLLDLLQRRDVDLSMLKHVVLDEADRMLDMGFIRDIDKIFTYVPRQRQTLLFSATIPKEVLGLANRYLYKPASVRAESGPTATELTEQFEIQVRADKFAVLLALLAKEKPERSLIFTRTKHGAKRLAKRLGSVGYRADALQGNLSQNARDRVMAEFRAGKFDHLIATDVAARGLDVKEITHVVNFDFPMVNEDYVHRIGRTGRAGKTGRAFLFVERGEERDARAVERLSGIPLRPFDLGVIPAAPPQASTGADAQHERDRAERGQGRSSHHHRGRGPARHASGGGAPRRDHASGGHAPRANDGGGDHGRNPYSPSGRTTGGASYGGRSHGGASQGGRSASGRRGGNGASRGYSQPRERY